MRPTSIQPTKRIAGANPRIWTNIFLDNADAVREALVNAVVHGNRYSANKVVHFKVTRTARAIEVVIEDQGSGFSTEMQGDPLAQENLMNQSGRGLALIRAFTDELQVERTTPGGTRVILRKFLPPEAG